MKYSYYPGCSLHSTAEEYSQSTLAVCRALGMEVRELADWNCCGASSAHSTSGVLAHALPLRNLVLAEKQGDDILAPCAACYNVLKSTEGWMREGGAEAVELNEKMQGIMGRGYQGGIRVLHPLEVLGSPETLAVLKSRAVNGLAGLKLASYYGCLLTRPPRQVAFEENPEQPQSMDRVVEAIGGQAVRWTHKTRCCGASLSISQTDLVVKLVGEIVAAARRAGAEALVTACPLCHSNLDTRQGEGGMPVFFVSELVGIALGLPGSDGWLKKHIINPSPVLVGRRAKVS